MHKSARRWLAFLVLIALALRSWGLLWGLPLRSDLHPDEHDFVMTHALRLMSRVEQACAEGGSFNIKTTDRGVGLLVAPASFSEWFDQVRGR